MKRPGPFGFGSRRPRRKTIRALVLADDLDRRDHARTGRCTTTIATMTGDGHRAILRVDARPAGATISLSPSWATPSTATSLAELERFAVGAVRPPELAVDEDEASPLASRTRRARRRDGSTPTSHGRFVGPGRACRRRTPSSPPSVSAIATEIGTTPGRRRRPGRRAAASRARTRAGGEGQRAVARDERLEHEEQQRQQHQQHTGGADGQHRQAEEGEHEADRHRSSRGRSARGSTARRSGRACRARAGS